MKFYPGDIVTFPTSDPQEVVSVAGDMVTVRLAKPHRPDWSDGTPYTIRAERLTLVRESLVGELRQQLVILITCAENGLLPMPAGRIVRDAKALLERVPKRD